MILRKLVRIRAWARGVPDTRLLVERGLRLGAGVYLAPRVVIDPDFCWLVQIGDETTLAPGTRVLAHDASTRRHLGYTRIASVRIGRRVFVGADSLVLPGVTIGDEAIVGAGSVVTTDVPAGTVVAGNPALPVTATTRHIARHRSQLGTRPTYPWRGYTLGGGITAENRARMWDELSHGEGYVE